MRWYSICFCSLSSKLENHLDKNIGGSATNDKKKMRKGFGANDKNKMGKVSGTDENLQNHLLES